MGNFLLKDCEEKEGDGMQECYKYAQKLILGEYDTHHGSLYDIGIPVAAAVAAIILFTTGMFFWQNPKFKGMHYKLIAAACLAESSLLQDISNSHILKFPEFTTFFNIVWGLP